MTPGIISIEPDGGDYVAYIDAMVGPPPEDPETAARLISEQLAERSRHNIEIMNSISNRDPAAANAALAAGRAAAPLGTNWGHGVQPQAAANPLRDGLAGSTASLQSTGRAATKTFQDDIVTAGSNALASLVSAIARLMVFAGIAWLAAAIVMSGQWPWLSPMPGVALFFVGVIVGNIARGGSRRRAAAP